MQDRYTGDIGDFGKYGLLRSLVAGSSDHDALRLGVVWYRTRPEANNDGRHVSYLSQPLRYRPCDPDLFNLLKRLVESDARDVRTVRDWRILPAGTAFFERFVEQGPLRDAWCNDALAATEGAELVFMDPDNGIEVDSVPRGRLRASKYVFYEEILPYVQRTQSLVIYHHLGQRHRSAEEEIHARLHRLAAYSKAPFALRFRGGTSRAYFIVPSEAHGSLLRLRAESFLSGGWAAPGLFESQPYG